jgi:hypothetical protein
VTAVRDQADDVLPPIEYLSAARAAIPGYAETERAARKVRRQVISPPTDVAQYPNVDALAAAAIAGEPVPADVGEQVWAADRAKEVERLRRLWTEQVAVRLDSELHTVVLHHADAGLAFLDGELGKILAAASGALQVAAGVRTADDALRASDDQRRAFVHLDEFTRRLERLRFAQRELMREALDYMSDGAGNTDRLLSCAGTVANLAEVCPAWNEAGIRGRTPDPLTGAVADTSRVTPWRSVSPDRPLVPVVDLDHLIWLAEGPGVAWVPTIEEARLATDALLASVSTQQTEDEKKRQERLGRQLDALVKQVMDRHRYETALGLRD